MRCQRFDGPGALHRPQVLVGPHISSRDAGGKPYIRESHRHIDWGITKIDDLKCVGGGGRGAGGSGAQIRPASDGRTVQQTAHGSTAARQVLASFIATLLPTTNLTSSRRCDTPAHAVHSCGPPYANVRSFAFTRVRTCTHACIHGSASTLGTYTRTATRTAARAATCHTHQDCLATVRQLLRPDLPLVVNPLHQPARMPRPSLVDRDSFLVRDDWPHSIDEGAVGDVKAKDQWAGNNAPSTKVRPRFGKVERAFGGHVCGIPSQIKHNQTSGQAQHRQSASTTTPEGYKGVRRLGVISNGTAEEVGGTPHPSLRNGTPFTSVL